MEDYENSVNALRKKYPHAVIHKILVFGVPAVDALQGSKNVIPILSSRLSTVTSMGTVMCDITSDYLAELAVLAITREMGSFKSPGLMELEHPVSAFQGDRPYSGIFQPNTHSRTHSPSNSFSSSTSKLASGLSSKTGSLSLGLTDRAKAKQHGRSKKYLAGLYLMAGRWQDALRVFSEAATSLKSAHDHLWFASALEGIGICLLLLSFLETPVAIPPVAHQATHLNHTHNHSFSDSAESLSPISTGSNTLPPPMFEFLPELTNTILRYYSRSQSTPEESVPQIVYCETILRFTNLLAVTRLNGGWNPASLSSVVRGTFTGKNITPDSPSVSAITSWLNRAYSTDLRAMPVLAQCNMYSGIASIYSNVNLLRKRSFIIRELLLTIIPILAKARTENASKEGSHKDSGIPTHLLDGEREAGIIELLDNISQVYGAGDISSIGYGWINLRVSFLKTCLEICETIPDYNGVVHFAGLLLSTAADSLNDREQIRIFKSIESAFQDAKVQGQGNVFSEFWDPNLIRDIKIVSTTSSILPQYHTKSSNAGDEGVFLHNPFAAKREASEVGDSNTEKGRILVQNERADFSIKVQNPFAFDLHIQEITLITKDVKVNAKVSNVYLSAKQITDVNIAVIPESIGTLQILGASVQIPFCTKTDYYLTENPIFVIENPDEKIKRVGCASGVGHGRKQYTELIKYRTVDIDVIPAQPVMVVKNISVNQGWMMLSEGERQVITVTLSNISDIEANCVSLKLFDSTTQPLQIALNNKDLAQNEIYEIEYFLYHRKALQWIQENGCSTPGQLTDDSFESGASYQSVFGPVSKQTTPVSVPSHSAKVFNILVLGKRGLTDGSIQVEYANRPKEEDGTVPLSPPFWHRTLSIPINITVNSSIELGGCDMMGLQGNQVFTDDPNVASASHLSKYLNELKIQKKMSEYCLFVVDLRNSLTQSVEVTLCSSPDQSYDDSFELEATSNIIEDEDRSSNDGSPGKYTVKAVIHAGKTRRLLVPIKRVQFTEEELACPVPSLTNRQFVLSVNSSPEKARATRENFWYRKALLSMLCGTWKVVNGLPRSGILELRGIRLTQKMINVLQVEPVSISMHMQVDGTAECGEMIDNTGSMSAQLDIIKEHMTEENDTESGHDYTVRSEEDFVTLYTRIRNKSPRRISGYLRIIPSQRYADLHTSGSTANLASGGGIDRWHNMDSKVLWNGSLQQAVYNIPAGGEAQISLGVLFLYRGEYEFTAMFDEFPVWEDEEERKIKVAEQKESQGFVDPSLDDARPKQHGQRDPIHIKAI